MARTWVGGPWRLVGMTSLRWQGADTHCVFSGGEFDSGIAFVERALRLNPNLASTWVLSGLLRNFTGEPDLAIEHLARAMRLSPLVPTLYHMQAGTGLAHLFAGRIDDACNWAEKALRQEPQVRARFGRTAAGHALARSDGKSSASKNAFVPD